MLERIEAALGNALGMEQDISRSLAKTFVDPNLHGQVWDRCGAYLEGQRVHGITQTQEE